MSHRATSGGSGSTKTPFPPLPLEEWRPTKDTLHLYCQIVGKIRLKLHPKRPHWWHVPLYVTVRGLTTRSIPYGDIAFSIDFDLTEHRLIVLTSDGRRHEIPLQGQSVAEFYTKLFAALTDLGIRVKILAKPYDHSSTEPFPSDREHATYDREYVERFWRILVGVDAVMNEFAGRFYGKTTPVHLFWHSFDLALTRFSGRRAPERQVENPVEREAYSHEVISFGFWAGDDRFPEPAFYSYTFPEPDGLAEQPLRPPQAMWAPQNGSHLAVLRYEDMRTAADPRQALLDFLQSSYEAGADLAGWDRAELDVRG